LDQYEFMVLISLLNGALKSIEILDISLSNVLQENEEYSTFMQTLNKTMKVISEITENIDSLRSDEMISIWKEVEKYSKSLNFIILNLSSDSNTEIVNKINEMIEDLSNDKVKVAHSVFLKYLSMSTTLDSI
jgi:GTPase involved in cell partitioning and DNA repair